MGLQVLTLDDLEKFRVQLLIDIENLLCKKQPKKWLKTPEVMDLLGLSEMTIQNMRRRGQIPFRKIGATCYYSAEEIDEYVTKSKYTRL